MIVTSKDSRWYSQMGGFTQYNGFFVRLED
jgi:hypothetical protein